MPSQLTGWRKSSHSHFEENACVEVGTAPGVVGVRDTKQAKLPETTRPVLVFADASFAAFVAHVASLRAL